MLRKVLTVGALLAAAGGALAGTVLGVVTDAVTGDPIVGAIVVVGPDGIGPRPQIDTTDANGRYSITWTGTYQAIALAKDYDTSRVVTGSVGAAELERVDFALMPLAAEYGRVAGAITDSLTTDPISGATVILRYYDVSGPRPTWVPVDTATTNASGAYAFTGVLAGPSYNIRVSATGYTTRTSATFTIIPDDVRTVDLRLVPVSTPVGAVDGIITDTLTTEPMANVTVILANSSASFTPETTTTNLMGVYSFTSIPAGNNYMVTASRAGYYTKTTATFTVVASDTVSRDLALRAYTASVGGLISSQAGGAVDGAMVILKRKNGASYGVVDSMIVGSDGIYAFFPLPADTYRVVASADGFYPDSSGDSIVTDGETQELDVTLRPVGSGNLHVRVALDSASNPPIADAMVYAVLQSGPVQQDTLVGTTRADGWVDFEDAVEGQYIISAYAFGFNPNQTTRQLTTNENDTGYILLTRSAGATKTISGIVRVSGSGLPVSGAVITLELGLYVIRDTAVTSGDYSITFPTSFTSGLLTATAVGYDDWDSTVSLTAASTNLNINMTPETGVAARSAAARSVTSVAVTGRNTLAVSADVVGTLSLYDMGGRLVYRTAVAAGQSAIRLPSRVGRSLVAELVSGEHSVRSTVVLR